MTVPRILIVEDDGNYLEIYRRCLENSDYEIFSARSTKKALALLEQQMFDIVLTDLKMLGGKEVFSGFGVLEQARAIDPEIQVIVITGYGGVEHALRAMRSGAYDFIVKGGDLRRKILLTVQSAIEVRLLKMEMLDAKSKDDINPESNRILGNSFSMQAISEEITRAAQSVTNILIYGESGTGKRLIAQTIHRQSERKNAPFFVIDCGNLSESTKDSELFGYQAGAKYENSPGQPGKFELANGGTIFLDGVNYLDVRFQANLLNILSEKQVIRVGGHKVVALDVRVIASTELTNDEMLEHGKFRRNLFDVLNEMVITVPPLRERKDGDGSDIMLLAAMFLKRHGADKVVDFSPGARELLNQYDYPGNVRELESIIKEAITRCDSSIIKAEDLRSEIRNRNQFLTHNRVVQKATEKATKSGQQTTVSLKKLKQSLNNIFSVDELRELCFDLGVDYDNLSGSRKTDKIIDLIAYFERRQNLDELISVCRELRPNLNW